MSENTSAIRYPRKRFVRGLLRGFGRLALPLLFEIEIQGNANFPKQGPLIVVGNHTAIMEVAMMAVYTPWQVEFIGSVDIPHEASTAFFAYAFGFIPIMRGHMDRKGLNVALDVLKQGGVIGIFPEGGIWEPGNMRPQTGVSWLSYMSGVPVLPLGFTSARGALGKAFKLQRPNLRMDVGELIAPAKAPEGVARKAYFVSYAEQVMGAVNALLPPEVRDRPSEVVDERFELEVVVADPKGNGVEIPSDLWVTKAEALTKLLHRPGILKIFVKNLKMPVVPLQNLHTQPAPAELVPGLEQIMHYLERENPYFLAYRFGPKQAEEMQVGLQEFLRLVQWAAGKEYTLLVKPIRRFYSPIEEKEIMQVEQGEYVNWR
ncbi:MAG: 1-acyl-sn-glycerol-3-phosphate acyltransferase [Anaerolineales bacterium]|nr:1-acyl-sn-glycerol-3-phosphate acyltransferase [Anaerolineales bacterium]